MPTETITSSQSWTVPTGVYSVAITTQAAGGAGSTIATGGGGGGGGASHSANIAVTPNETITILVGPPGVPGSGQQNFGGVAGWEGGNGDFTVACGGGMGGEDLGIGGAGGSVIASPVGSGSSGEQGISGGGIYGGDGGAGGDSVNGTGGVGAVGATPAQAGTNGSGGGGGNASNSGRSGGSGFVKLQYESQSSSSS